jgi:chromate transporter
MQPDAKSETDRNPPAEPELFVAFLTIGLSAFGGALPWARRVLVEKRGWMSPDVFNETLALCQALPGPNVVNLSVVVGARWAGPLGAVSALLGLVGAPVGIGEVGRVPGAITGLGAAASGLVWATAAKMARPLVTRRPISGSAVFALTFTAIVWMKLPLPAVLLALAPIGMGVVWLGAGKRRGP